MMLMVNNEKTIKKLVEKINALDCKNTFYRNFWKELFSYWLQLLSCLVRAYILLAACYGIMLLVWSRSAKPNRSNFSFLQNRRYSSLLFLPSLLFSCSPHYSLRQFILSPTSLLSFFPLEKLILIQTPFLIRFLTWTISSQSQILFSLCIFGQNFLGPICRRTWKKLPLLTYTKILPLDEYSHKFSLSLSLGLKFLFCFYRKLVL